MTAFAYGVDLDQLADTVSDLGACEHTFTTLLADLDRRVEALHVTWSGEAAVAHRHAHAAWVRGFGAMRDGLAQMREAGGAAHDNYTAALEANQRLWALP